MSQDDEDRRHKLAVIATALGEEVASLRAAEEQQTKAFVKQAKALAALEREVAKKNYRTTIKLRVLYALAAAIMLLFGATAYGYFKIKEVVAYQYVIRSQVLCPLYKIFVHSYNPDSVAAKTQGIAEYTATFTEIRKQYQALNCGPE